MLRSDNLAYLRRDWRGVAFYSLLAGVWMATLLVIGALVIRPAAAQTWFCTRPAKPYVLFSASEGNLQFAQDAVAAYLKKMKGYLECLQMESDDAASEANRVGQRMEQPPDADPLTSAKLART
jgi:hypothetical protein